MNNLNIKSAFRLTNGYKITGDSEAKFLYNSVNGIRYELEKAQWQLLDEIEQAETLGSLITGYDEASVPYMTSFLSQLEEIGALEEKRPPVTSGKPLQHVKAPHLRSVHFELVSSCNMKCKHCYQKDYLFASDDLTDTEIVQLAHQMDELQVEVVGISGGEPFTRPRLFDLIREFENKKIRVSSILTNGLLLEENILNILSMKSDCVVFVSLDGAKKESLAFRGVSKAMCGQIYDTIINGVKAAVNAGIKLMINTTVTPENVKELTKIYDLLCEIGVRGWRVALPKNVGAFVDNRKDYDLDFNVAFESYYQVIEHHLQLQKTGAAKFELQIEHFFRDDVMHSDSLDKNYFVCDYDGKMQSCCIKPNGDVTPCPLMVDSVIGNIRSENLGDIWHRSEMQSYKTICIHDVKQCEACEKLTYCATGCRANAIFETGDLFGKDPNACYAMSFLEDHVIPMLQKYGYKINLTGRSPQ